MQRNWRDFKALHSNISGAREAFENACEVLFKKMYPNRYVSQMEVSRGDGGIDIFIGEYSKEPIIVVQCKFFLENFGHSQKQQIKDSSNKAFNNKDYELNKWILCLPRVFTQQDNEWWFEWKQNQNIDIELLNGNELINLMQEYDIYNQIFQMEDSLLLKEIHNVLIPKKKKITHLSDESVFLKNIFCYLERKQPIMLLSITSSPFHYRIENYYKEKIIEESKKIFDKAIFFDIELPNSKSMSEKKYFQYLAKQCHFKGDIDDGYDFKIFMEDSLEKQDVFLIVSEFENGLDEHRGTFASQLRALHQKFRGRLYTVLFGREKLASLKHKMGLLSPLNIFEEYLLPTPTLDDYEKLMDDSSKIEEIYTLTGGHPELMEYCFNNLDCDYRDLILNSNKFFDKYYDYKDELLELFEKEKFGYFMIWSNRDSLHRKLFWDNLIVQDGNKFRWISPIVVEIGKRYFR